jgi:hypothetical protein
MGTKHKRSNAKAMLRERAKQKFVGFEEGNTMVKMRKPGKKEGIIC